MADEDLVGVLLKVFVFFGAGLFGEFLEVDGVAQLVIQDRCRPANAVFFEAVDLGEAVAVVVVLRVLVGDVIEFVGVFFVGIPLPTQASPLVVTPPGS